MKTQPFPQRFEEFRKQQHATVYPEQESDIHEKITRMAIDQLFNRFLPIGQLLVLDVGAGRGYATKEFANRGHACISTTMQQTEVERLVKLGALDAQIADQNDLPFADGLFDLVFARHVLEHSIAPFWTLHEFFRVVKPGGFLYAEMPAPGTASNHEGNMNHFSVMDHPMWKSLIWRTGFEVVESQDMKFNVAIGPDRYFNFFCKKPL